MSFPRRVVLLNLFVFGGICLSAMPAGVTPDSSRIRQVDSLNLKSRDLSFVDLLEAARLATRALEISTSLNYEQGLAYAYRNLSSVHSTEGNYFLTMEYVQRALAIFEASKDSVGIANCYISLGHTYRRLGSREKELFYHGQSYEIFQRLGIKERVAVTAHNLGESYLNVGDLARSEQLTRIAISLNDSLGNKPVLSSCYKVMGRIYFDRNDLTTSSDYFRRVLSLTEELGKDSQKFATAESMIYLAMIAEKLGQRREYGQLLENGLTFARQNRLSEQLELLYAKLITHYSTIGNLMKTQQYVREYENFISARSIEANRNTEELLNTAASVRRLETQRDALQRDIASEQKAVRMRTAVLAIVGIVALLGFWLVFRLLAANKRIQAISMIRKSQADTIEQQRVELERLNNTKDKFFSIVAHDLKAPLHSLQAFAGLLSDHLEHMTKEEVEDLSRQLRKSIDNTLKMADDLILWAKLQMGTVEVKKENVEVGGIVREVEQLYSNIAGQKGIKLAGTFDEGVVIFANRDQVVFVVRNLVNNAIKYTSTGGNVDIHAGYGSGGKVHITVKDTGVGMPPGIQEKLFRLGQVRSVPGTAGEKGTGLGLVLAYEFAKLNDAAITFSSVEDAGTTFTITFS